MATRMWQASIEDAGGDLVTDQATAERAVAELIGDGTAVEDEDAEVGIWLVEVPDGLMSEWILEDTRGPLGEVEVTGGEFRMVIPLH